MGLRNSCVQVAGWLGGALLACCALPLVVSTVRDGHAHGVDPVFLALWFSGEAAMLVHVLFVEASLPLKLNYIANVIMVGIVGWYRWML